MAVAPPLRLRPLVLLPVLLLVASAAAQELADRVTETRLDNGMRVILVEQPAAPVIAFAMMFDVGGIDEPPGLGGIAHMAEHMAFKGTTSLGTADPQAEARALAELEILALALAHARSTGDEAAIVRLEQSFAAARERAQGLASSSPIDDLLSTSGAVGLNAATGNDFTRFTVSLPANRLELYARVYADVLSDTVFRYFYEERDVVREERRQSSEDDPQGVLFEAFLREAFHRHPYGRPLIGEPSEIEAYTATEAEAFWDLYYQPDRAVLVLVGDVEPERDLPILERYFGRLPSGPSPRAPLPAEPEQTEERRVTVRFDAQPQLAVGWKKPTYPERDAYVLDLIDALLTDGRTSRLYRRMVLEDGTALSVTTSSAFPGSRDDNLFLFYGQPRAPAGPADLEAALYEELARLADEGVGARELEKVKNRVRASTVRQLASASGLASSLAYHELFAGGWERLTEDLEIYESITAEEIQEVARRTFAAERRTVAVLLPEEE